MKVSIFGLGYVGIITAGCFARDGIHVIGVDINQDKINNIKKGIPPIIEDGLGKLLDEGIKTGRIEATTDCKYAVLSSEISLVSVGTPSRSDGAQDLTFVERVITDIANAVKIKKTPHTIVIRSTVFPGTTRHLIGIARKIAGDTPIYYAFNPEFLREGAAIQDFDEAPFTVIGTEDEIAEQQIRNIYATVDAPFYIVKPEEAELLKYATNSWHAVKITFANEIGRLAKFANVDARRVMDILIDDKKLNISSIYMKPGFAYGGSCLPKDVRAIDYFSKINNISVPLISSLAQSNNAQIESAISIISKKGFKKIGLLGLSFKSGTDDLRESPSVELAERLIGKGFDLKILDHNVNESKLIGSNKIFIEQKIPHLSRLMVNNEEELINHSELIIVSHGAAEFRFIIDKITKDKFILDFTGMLRDEINHVNYEGIAW